MWCMKFEPVWQSRIDAKESISPHRKNLFPDPPTTEATISVINFMLSICTPHFQLLHSLLSVTNIAFNISYDSLPVFAIVDTVQVPRYQLYGSP